MIDSHAHLGAPEFKDDFSEVIARAKASGLHRIVNIASGYGREGIDRALRLVASDPSLVTTIGIHPHEAGQYDRSLLGYIENFLERPRDETKIVAVGETGLDFHYRFSARNAQIATFEAQIDLARRFDLPLVLHVREAFETTVSILMREAPLRGIAHCFTGTLDEAERYIALGFYISIPGIVTFKRSESLRQIIPKLPLAKLLVETDAPYLAPVPMRGKRNEPAYLTYTIAVVAQALGLPKGDVGRVLAENARQIYNF